MNTIRIIDGTSGIVTQDMSASRPNEHRPSVRDQFVERSPFYLRINYRDDEGGNCQRIEIRGGGREEHKDPDSRESGPSDADAGAPNAQALDSAFDAAGF